MTLCCLRAKSSLSDNAEGGGGRGHRRVNLAPPESAQYAVETLRDVFALQRFAQHFLDPDRTRALVQWNPAVAARQYDRDVGARSRVRSG